MLLSIITGQRQGVLATIAADGRPQLSNVLYVWDGEEHIARVSTTADRAKPRNLRRDPRAALHVPGSHFWQYAVADCAVTLSEVASEPGDEAVRELAAMHAVFYAEQDPARLRGQHDRRAAARGPAACRARLRHSPRQAARHLTRQVARPLSA